MNVKPKVIMTYNEKSARLNEFIYHQSYVRLNERQCIICVCSNCKNYMQMFIVLTVLERLAEENA